MILLEEHKHFTEHKPIEKAPLSAKVSIPLSQHLGRMCEPTVTVGQTVCLGDALGAASAHIWAPVHASVSGKVAAIQERPHPVLGMCRAVVIENDGQDTPSVGRPALRTEEAVARLSPDEIRAIIFEAGIVGMGGASFPTHIKLKPPGEVDTLIVNGAECEPYLTCDYRLMQERRDEILKGIGIIAKTLGVTRVVIAIEDNKPEAIESFRAAGKETGYMVVSLKTMYPQGGEKQLVKSVLKRQVPRGKLPFDVGVVVQNVATVFAVYEAAYLDKPLYERVVTVTGSCLSEPKNFLVRIGTPVKELIAQCGPLKEDPAKILCGGPMMGIAQYTDEYPVIKSTSGVLLLNAKEARGQEEQGCIRCGACVHKCPMALIPTLIAQASRKESWGQAKYYGALDCIECGVCTYVCPSSIRLVQSIKRAKQELMKK